MGSDQEKGIRKTATDCTKAKANITLRTGQRSPSHPPTSKNGTVTAELNNTAPAASVGGNPRSTDNDAKFVIPKTVMAWPQPPKASIQKARVFRASRHAYSGAQRFTTSRLSGLLFRHRSRINAVGMLAVILRAVPDQTRHRPGNHKDNGRYQQQAHLPVEEAQRTHPRHQRDWPSPRQPHEGHCQGATPSKPIVHRRRDW